MAPILRSTKSPVKPASSGGSSPATTPTSTPRKAPQCAQCGRPRAGHPRQGCPYAAAATKDDSHPEETSITDALGSMKIQTFSARHDDPDTTGTWELEDTKTAVRQRRRRESAQRATIVPSESIASMSTSSSEILNLLLDDNNIEDEDDGFRKTVVRWQDALSTPKAKLRKSRARDKTMPCTFPGTAPSVASVAPYPTVQEPQLTPKLAKDEEHILDLSAVVDVSPSAKPLTRSMSSLQRSSFIDSLNSRYKQTTAYLLPKSDITEIEAAALKHGLHTRRVTSVESENEEQVLVVGQDPADTQKFYATIEGQAKLLTDNTEAKTDSRRSSGLKAVAGAAVVGAVATFTGLAFS
ncbi:hypothetical protein DFS33DRAFT_633018 [Desarmillaria ectypa]|nr:hypothetical protein DFS33DRAFT_633018 [Desarmillaria ectypa]